MHVKLIIDLFCIIIVKKVNCEWNEWVQGQCSTTCGPGESVRVRTKSVTESHGGTCSGETTDTELCNEQDCPCKLLQSLYSCS